MMLREHSRTDNRSLIGLAGAIVDGHRLLPKRPPAPPRPSSPGCATATSPLQHANAVRVARAELKRDVKGARASARSSAMAGVRMTIAELLSSQRPWGST